MLLNAERDLTLPLLRLARFLVVFVLRNSPPCLRTQNATLRRARNISALL